MMRSGDKHFSYSFLHDWICLHLEVRTEETPQPHTHTHSFSADHQQLLSQKVQLERSNPAQVIKHRWAGFYGVSPNSITASQSTYIRQPSQLFSQVSASL